jgi:hypothetical protein
MVALKIRQVLELRKINLIEIKIKIHFYAVSVFQFLDMHNFDSLQPI